MIIFTKMSSVFIRTAKGDTMSDSVRQVLDLLISWNLPQLCAKFQEEEVCINALKHLSEHDICELIPKIGPRAIFRSALQKWLSTQQEDIYIYNEKNSNVTPDKAINNAPPKIENVSLAKIIKVEDFEDQQTNGHDWFSLEVENAKDSSNELLVNEDIDNKNNSIEMQENESFIISLSDSDENEDTMDTENAIVDAKSNDVNEDDLLEEINIQEMLNKNFDGRKALKFYETNQYLDSNHRRCCVKAIISAIIENKMHMNASAFSNLTEQIIKLFPNETPGTYYIPRQGNSCPRGALYNKYLNMCRHLRRDGLLDYSGRRSTHSINKNKGKTNNN